MNEMQFDFEICKSTKKKEYDFLKLSFRQKML